MYVDDNDNDACATQNVSMKYNVITHMPTVHIVVKIFSFLWAVFH